MHADRWTRKLEKMMRGWGRETEEGGADPHVLEMARRLRHGRGGHGGHGFFGGHGNPFGGNPFGGNPFARRTRAKRGDVRAAILALLAEQPRNGYQVMQELEQRSRGLWRPSPGSVYPSFQQLEDEGLIRAEEGGGGKVYRLTAAGEEAARKIAASGEPPWDAQAEDEDDTHVALMDQMRQLGMALFQIAHNGNPAQGAEALRILTDARKSLYQILASDEPEKP